MSCAAFHLNCPRCGLTVTPKADSLAAEYCSRCLGRSRLAVRLFGSRLPAEQLYAAGRLPSAGHGR